jgi:uncharacterized protein (TIGR02265 family)
MSKKQPEPAKAEESTPVTNKRVMLMRGTTLKAVLDGCGVNQLPTIQKELAHDFKLDYNALPLAYPFSRHVEVLEWLRLKLYPEESEAKGYEKIGYNSVKGFLQEGIGPSLEFSASVLGVERHLPIFFGVLEQVLDFSHIDVLEQQPGYVCFVFSNVTWPPEMTVGIALAMMETAKAKHPSVKYTRLNDKDTQFELNW